MAANKKKSKPIQFQIGWPGLIAIVVSTVCVLLWTFVLGFWMGQKVFTGCESASSVETAVKPHMQQSRSNVELPARNDEILYGNETTLFDQNEKAIEDLREQLKLEEPKAESPAEVVTSPAGAQEKAAIKEKGLTETTQKAARDQKEKKKVKKAEAKKKSPKAEASKKKEPREYFSLQIASYKTRSQAEKESSRWQKKGYHVQIQKADLKRKGIWYRVLLGKYSSLDRAKKEASKLAAKDGIRSYVVKSRK
ncbi:MAG: hypothetical protein DSZ23_02525 [Thermodesulfatator sp.]|nr:MAG: hypothetical protein DSZ23_02525 [Thermodesulfatator sp.]